MPDEPWTEVHDIVQEIGIKTIPKKQKCKKVKWLSEEALQIAEKRRETNGKEEKERYSHLNAEFQRIARRGKNAFLSDQCREIWRSSIQSAKTRLVADYGSDHVLLTAKFRLKLKKIRKTTRPFRYDLNQIPYYYTIEVRNRFRD